MYVYALCMVCVRVVSVYSDLAEGPMVLFTGVGGVTHIKFSPDGSLLFVGLRKVLCIYTLGYSSISRYFIS